MAVQFGGDEGLFTANPTIGNDLINQQLANARSLGLTTGADYNGLTAGPLLPPSDKQNAALPFGDASGPAPLCSVATAASTGFPVTVGTGSGLPLSARGSGAGPLVPLFAAVVLLGSLYLRRRHRARRS